MKKLTGALFFLFSLSAGAQLSPSSAEILLGLRKLKVLGSVLYVAAHPDDENTRLLTYFSKDRLYRTGYLSLTRGDGGQNLIGNEQGVELGLIRTQELLAARRVDGAEQFFTRAYDFGFSKTPDETFSKWNRERILSDVVWVIRRFQPDVIITRFPTTGEGGHGHHTASAILANEAFAAAADPKRFPEQLAFVQPWQAKRVAWNTFNFGGNNTTNSEQLHFDVGGFNPVLGKSYGEIAAESRSQHKSQGFGVARGRGEALEYFRTTSGKAPSSDLFEDVTTSWQRVPGGAAIEKQIDALIAGFDLFRPERSVPQLVRLFGAVRGLPEGNWKTQKLREIQGLVLMAGGLWADAFTNTPFVAQGDTARVQLSLNNRLGAAIRVVRVSLNGKDTVLNKPLEKNINFTLSRNSLVSPTHPLTMPYWLQRPMHEGAFDVREQQLIGQPDISPAFTARIDLEVEGQPFTIERPVQYRYTDPVKGELYQPFYVIQPLSIITDPASLIAVNGKAPVVKVEVESFRPLGGSFSLQEGQGAASGLPSLPSSLPAGRRQELSFTDPRNFARPAQAKLSFLTANGLRLSNGFRVIRHDHIPDQLVPASSEYTVKPVDLKIYHRRIGYITGAGDKVPEALEQMGYEVTLLTDKELTRNNLKQYDAIISGVRAYNTNDWLNNHYEKLMAYVEEGGNLIVQYNTSNQIGPVRAKIGPYPFTITRNRITDENASPTFLVPDHPVFQFPNKITEADFGGWVQERSIYHAAGMDPKFVPLLQFNDPGEGPDKGSLIVAPHGKGYFTYTGLVFFRQLPAGVPGAYRLLANLIALNRKKEF
jgi:LmbE family N-acetylglucosaminyl deacetylase